MNDFVMTVRVRVYYSWRSHGEILTYLETANKEAGISLTANVLLMVLEALFAQLDTDGKQIIGVAVLGYRLHVVCVSNNTVFVFDNQLLSSYLEACCRDLWRRPVIQLPGGMLQPTQHASR